MGGHEQCRGVSGKLLHEHAPGPFIQTPGGFVQEEDLRLHGEERRQGAEAFLTPRKRIGRAGGEMRQAEPLQNVEGSPVGFFPGNAEVERAEGHVLQKGRAEEHVVRILEEQSHGGAETGEVLSVRHGRSVEEDLPFRRAEQSNQEMQECGLARAVAAPERTSFSFSQGEGDVPEYLPLAGIGEGERACLEEWRP